MTTTQPTDTLILKPSVEDLFGLVPNTVYRVVDTRGTAGGGVEFKIAPVSADAQGRLVIPLAEAIEVYDSDVASYI